MTDVDLSDSGRECRYYRQMACVLPAARNPGLLGQCLFLTHLALEWDDFVERAERFRLTEKEAGELWNARHPALALQFQACPGQFCPPLPDFRRDERPAGAGGSCRYLHDTSCLLLLPRCPGRCSAFYR